VWQKLANISLYDRWATSMMKFGNSEVWQEPNTYQIAKIWLGKLWLGTKHLLILLIGGNIVNSPKGGIPKI
jgi:hypothetical protein